MRFVGIAKHFCGVVEKKHRSKRRFVEQVLNATVALYGAGLELPDTNPEPGYNPAGDWFERNKHLPLEEQLKRSPDIREHYRRYDRIRKRTAANLGGDQPYRQMFNPFDSGEAPVVALLSDDLSDIYCDVEKGLSRIKKDSQAVSTNVIWQWKFDLQSHWGKHAVSALNALHVLAFDK